MTSKLRLTVQQAQALLKAAERERGIVEYHPASGVITLIPKTYAEQIMKSGSREDDAPRWLFRGKPVSNPLEQWRRRQEK